VPFGFLLIQQLVPLLPLRLKPRPTEFKLPAADVVLDLRRVKTGK
jgi:hypothetical protein